MGILTNSRIYGTKWFNVTITRKGMGEGQERTREKRGVRENKGRGKRGERERGGGKLGAREKDRDG